MQINFEPEKIKAAKAYVDRLTPIKVPKSTKIKKTNDHVKLDEEFYATKQKTSFIKSILNFLFK